MRIRDGNAEQKRSGVEPGLLRLSVGIEHIDDIKQDLELAIQKSVNYKLETAAVEKK